MSFGPRSIAKAAASCSRASTRASSSTSTSAQTQTPLSPLKAGLILSRQPLLTKTLHPLEKTYLDFNLKLRHALSNPIPERFYFREGSLGERRFQLSEYEYVKEIYGKELSGPAPKVGDIPPERPVTEFERDHWVKKDEQRGEKSLERCPESEIFCLVQDKSGRWDLPIVTLNQDETLSGSIDRWITGTEGWFDGKTMDTWLVTRKPVGLVKKGDDRTYYLKSHILAGEPKLSKDSPWKSHAWLTRDEVKARLAEKWEDVRQIFGSRQ